ncbi:MAG: hypothetical protein A2Z65_09800 [Gallionellales bacterium RIFCSPLOWO2_02_58_13]|nr:MAG: hypothetical protein A2Z65_09800 [Gallionellales bacterium RIFCSPLOWO2_02_58_13]
MEIWIQAQKAESQFVPQAFAGTGGHFAASTRSRFAPIGRAIGLARDARICPQTASPSSRNLMKYPG